MRGHPRWTIRHRDSIWNARYPRYPMALQYLQEICQRKDRWYDQPKKRQDNCEKEMKVVKTSEWSKRAKLGSQRRKLAQSCQRSNIQKTIEHSGKNLPEISITSTPNSVLEATITFSRTSYKWAPVILIKLTLFQLSEALISQSTDEK